MHHNMDSQIEHKQAGMIRAHVQLNIDKKKKTQVKQIKAVNQIPLTNEMLLPLSICMNEWIKEKVWLKKQPNACSR